MVVRRLLDILGLKRKGAVSVQATVIRADGRREELGEIAKGTVTMTPEKG